MLLTVNSVLTGHIRIGYIYYFSVNVTIRFLSNYYAIMLPDFTFLPLTGIHLICGTLNL